jgi:NADH dehydrogenase
VVDARRRGRHAPDYRYRDIGELAMVGRFRTVARLPFAHFAGPLAWLLWLGVHLYYLKGLQNRALVAVRWLWAILTGGRGSRLITGSNVSYGSLPSVGLSADGAARAVTGYGGPSASAEAAAGRRRAG